MSSAIKNEAAFRKLLAEAWNRRAALRASTDAFRLLNGAASGTPGLAADYFAGTVVAYAYGADLAARYGDFARALADAAGARGVTIKDRAAPDEADRREGSEAWGEVPETAEVREGPLRFRVHLLHPRNVGLFLDTRPLRETLAGCEDHRVLNLFSYTCSLGAAAALRNRAQVVNVDISARYLEMGRENFRASGIPLERAQFKRMDAEAYLDWALRKSLAFDVIILDPPSFSRGSFARGDRSEYSFTRDYWRLLDKCARLCAPGGRVFALTNYGKITAREFRAKVDETLRAAGRPAPASAPLPAPEDFDPGGPAPEASLIAVAASLP